MIPISTVHRNSESELPIPEEWRGIIFDIVKSLVVGDFSLSKPIDGVRLVSEETAAQNKQYVSDFGEKLIDLPDETWKSSVYIWMESYWEAIVDLWSEREGRSDLVLNLKVYESEDSYSFEVGLVYVP